MKRACALITAVMMLFCFTACKNNKTEYDTPPEGMDNPQKDDEITVKAENDFEVPLPEEFTFDYNMDEYITLPDYTSEDFKFNRLPLDDSALQKDIEFLKLESESAKVTQVNRESQTGDYLVFDYTSVFDNGENALSGNNIGIVLGNDMFAPGFDDYVEGLKKDQSSVFKYTFPESWTTNIMAAGKTLTFTVKVKYVNEVILPELETVLSEQEIKDEAELMALLTEKREETNRYNFLEEIIKQSTVTAYPQKEYAYCESLFEADIEARARMQGITKEQVIASEYNNSTEKYEKAKKAYAENKCKRAMVAYYLRDKYGFELTKNEYNLCIEDYFNENGKEMGLKSVSEVHTNLGEAMANSLFSDLAAKAAYNEKAR